MEAHQNTIKFCQRKMKRKILKVSVKDKISTIRLMMSGLPDVAEHANSQKLKWGGYVPRFLVTNVRRPQSCGTSALAKGNEADWGRGGQSPKEKSHKFISQVQGGTEAPEEVYRKRTGSKNKCMTNSDSAKSVNTNYNILTKCKCRDGSWKRWAHHMRFWMSYPLKEATALNGAQTVNSLIHSCTHAV